MINCDALLKMLLKMLLNKMLRMREYRPLNKHHSIPGSRESALMLAVLDINSTVEIQLPSELTRWIHRESGRLSEQVN